MASNHRNAYKIFKSRLLKNMWPNALENWYVGFGFENIGLVLPNDLFLSLFQRRSLGPKWLFYRGPWFTALNYIN